MSNAILACSCVLDFLVFQGWLWQNPSKGCPLVCCNPTVSSSKLTRMFPASPKTQRPGVEHWMVLILHPELSQHQHTSCTFVSSNWEQGCIGGHLVQQCLLNNLIITCQQLNCAGMHTISQRKNAATVEGQQQPLFAANSKLLSHLLTIYIATLDNLIQPS